jgi:hypothetical protein
MNEKDQKKFDSLELDMLLGIFPDNSDDWKFLLSNCELSEEAQALKNKKLDITNSQKI